jgi:hypothetical protein
MQKVITWAGRGALLVVLAVCVVGALDPNYNAKKWAPPADAVMHVIYGYLLTALSILALPKIRPWKIGGFYLALGAGLELTQILGVVSGTFQWKDLISNIAGVVAVLFPMWLARRKAR